jgi:hypothetical protein
MRIGVLLRVSLTLALLCAVSAVIVTKNIGDITVFSAENAEKRALLHHAILNNKVPDGTSWSDLGANNLNVRVAVVWIADRLSELSGRPVDHVYRAMDLLCLFGGLMLMFFLLRTWYAPLPAVAGLLMFCTLLPLTMLDHYFHPWDRPMLLLWGGMLLALCQGRLFLFTLIYVVAIVVKFDSAMAAGMVWFTSVHRESWRRPTLITAGIAAIGAVVLGFLVNAYPGGQEPIDIAAQFRNNIQAAVSAGIAYRPLLAHGLLFALGLLGWASADSMMKRLWLFGLAMLVPHLMFTNFIEVRAQVGTVLCMLPLALHAVTTACNSLEMQSAPKST